MGKHDESQVKVDALKVGDEIASPGVEGVVLAKARPLAADTSAYAQVTLLTTVKGNEYHPFRVGHWYFTDDGPKDTHRWQSYSGLNCRTLGAAIELFEAVTDSRIVPLRRRAPRR